MAEEAQTQNKTPLRRPVRQIQVEEEKTERISKVTGATMVIVALSINAFVALLNILVIGEFVSEIILLCADLAFMIWFWTKGVSFVKKPKNLAAMGIQAFIGLIPVINTLPALSSGILTIVLLTRSEDKGGLLSKAASMSQSKTK